MNQLQQKYNVEEDPTDPAPPPFSSSLSLFSSLQLELARTRTKTRWTRTRTKWTRGIIATWMKNWTPNFDSVEEVCSPGTRGPCLYSLLRWIWAVGSNQHWLNGYPWSFRSVEHNPQNGFELDTIGGRAPWLGPVRPPLRSRGFWSLLDDRKLHGTLISLCKPNVWAFIRDNHVFAVCRSGIKFPKGNIEESLRSSWYLVRPSRLRGDRDLKWWEGTQHLMEAILKHLGSCHLR